ncbi:MAG: hypothetical protein H3C48_08645 [Chitinophagaceae bacterium]|nr:hypothetical protein [Chitinophagaceae bacterium]
MLFLSLSDEDIGFSVLMSLLGVEQGQYALASPTAMIISSALSLPAVAGEAESHSPLTNTNNGCNILLFSVVHVWEGAKKQIFFINEKLNVRKWG